MTRFLILGLLIASYLATIPDYDHHLYDSEMPAVPTLHASLK